MYAKISELVSRATALTTARKIPAAARTSREAALDMMPTALTQEQFRRRLCQERKRSERSRKKFLLMLVRGISTKLQTSAGNIQVRLPQALDAVIRDTDTVGWFESESVIGVIFSELGDKEPDAAAKVIEGKIAAALEEVLTPNLIRSLELEFYSFPSEQSIDGYKLPIEPEFYPDLFDIDTHKKLCLLTKRLMDIVGSLCALTLLLPIFAVLAALIKLTSKGPVFFRQERLGQYEVPFMFLKFRSMRVASDAEIHKEYVKNFIAGRAEPNAANGKSRPVYKITNDPRVTWIGKFMRRTSLDETPQFWNVFVGQMSLVGPRPPIRYELEAYDIWHRRRLLEVKPGITGLWQIHGRSRTTFDEMVRLDLKYAKAWSLLTDLKILIQTPRAVVSGDGAY